MAINPVTNKIYVVDEGSNAVVVIDGATNLLTSVPVGNYPVAVAVNTATNKIYVANADSNTATVIDGVTLGTTTVAVGTGPFAVDVNPNTNMIYVANSDDNTVTVINETTVVATLPVGDIPVAVAVNPVTNRVYVGNQSWVGNSSISVINGANNTVLTTVALPGYALFYPENYPGSSGLVIDTVTNQVYANGIIQIFGMDGSSYQISTGSLPGCDEVGLAINSVTDTIYAPDFCVYNGKGQGAVDVINAPSLDVTAFVATGYYSFQSMPVGLAVDSVTNKIYVADQTGIFATIDGVTNSVASLFGTWPWLVGMNSASNTAYFVNEDGTAAVLAGAGPTQFVAMTPCRLVDTRPPNGSGPLSGGTTTNFNVTQLGNCNVPATAAAYSMNVTVIPPGPLGYLTIWPDGQFQPYVSTMNSDGRIKANAAIVPAGNPGAVDVYVSDTTNVILDIDGYFTPPASSTLAFYSLPPCRLVDTRLNNLGGPYLQGAQERDFNLQNSANDCIPQNVVPSAYSLNITAVPHPSGLPLSYLTMWPQGQPQPLVSTLNNPTGTIVANAALVSPGSTGEVAVYPTNDTDLLIDINGYFAPPGSGGLSLYAEPPCRVLDTRFTGGAFTGQLVVPVETSSCVQPNTAQTYVLNATVIPVGGLGFLTLWADQRQQPVVSTLNAIDGAITSNMAIVPTNDGSIDAYAAGLTQLILDISGYFAP